MSSKRVQSFQVAEPDGIFSGLLQKGLDILVGNDIQNKSGSGRCPVNLEKD